MESRPKVMYGEDPDMSKNQLSIWTVYKRPLDHPDKYVARRWLATPQPTPTDDKLLADDLDALRKKLPPGLIRMSRQPEDDPVIVESWI